MSFINLTPDISPSGTPLPLISGLRYFYFSFIASSSFIDLYFSRNQYRNEEYITKLYTSNSSTSLLTTVYVKNIIFPTSFSNGLIGLSTPNGSMYMNNTNIPNCKIVNLIQGNTYFIESRTIYNDLGVDFGIIIKSGLSILPLTYLRTETTSIPFPPIVPPIPLPTPDGIPPVPIGLTLSNGIYGVILNWNESLTATVYNIYRNGRFIGRTPNLKFIDSYPISGCTYNYSISASNTNGESLQTINVSFTPIFSFTSLIPDRSYDGISFVGVGIRYYYYLFVPLSSTIDVFLHFNGILNQSALIGLYDSTNVNTNMLNNSSTISNLDANMIQGNFTLGSDISPQLFVYGIRFTAVGQYINNTIIPNFKINNLINLNTYILEVASVSNSVDDIYADLGMYLKNSMGGLFNNYFVQLTFNTTTLTRSIPSPYIIAFNFNSTSTENYSTFVNPNLFAFQHVKNVLENIITTSPNARLSGRTNDMLVNFNVESLPSGVLGQSSLTNWKSDKTRSPDFPFEQEITFNNQYFINGYFTSEASFNGSKTLNSLPNNAFFNTLIHEILHGLGIYYIDYYNTSSYDIGWAPFLTNVIDNNPWYKGPSSSAALESYKLDCKNNSLLRIPIENNYGQGTANSHWDEGNSPSSSSEKRFFSSIYHPAFKLELMTGFLNKNDYLTGLTAGALKDYGFNVNLLSPYVSQYPFQLIPTSANSFSYTDDKYFSCTCNKKGHHILLETPNVSEHISSCSTLTTVSTKTQLEYNDNNNINVICYF